METLTKENGTITKTFKSGLGVKACKYWKDEAHWYNIINEYDVIKVHIGGKCAGVDRTCYEGIKSYIVEILTSNDENYFEESTKDEFNEAYKKALKIINS